MTQARQRLANFDGTASASDDASRRTGLVSAINSAEESVTSAQRRLQALDEDRQGADSTVTASIGTQRSQYSAAQNAMPAPPRVSAGVAVNVRMPNGTVQRVSATSLAELKDPAQIRKVWDAMTEGQRQQLTSDFPLLIGNLDGIPLRDRNTANVITAKSYREELEKRVEMLELMQKQPYSDGIFGDQIKKLRGEVKSIDAILGDRNDKYRKEEGFGKYTIYDEHGKQIPQDGTTLVGFNPLRDSIVTFQGALNPETGDIPTWMQHVGISVPGTRSMLSNFTSDLNRGKDLMYGSGKNSGYFVWHGAPLPDFDLPEHIVDPAQRGFADVAAPRLASFVNSLKLGPKTEVIPIAHSYGAAVLGGAEYLGLKADRIVYVAPAGLGHNVGSIDDIPNTKKIPHFVLQARNDQVVGWNQGKSGLGLEHGSANPLDTPGVTRLETGYLDDKNPGAGTIESTGGMEAHSKLFERDSTSMKNITNVVKGGPVSIYHPNDKERIHVGGAGSSEHRDRSAGQWCGETRGEDFSLGPYEGEVMIWRQRAIAAVLAVGVICAGVTGCASEERKAAQVAQQQKQLDGYIAKADGWGEDILKQIPKSEIETANRVASGTREANTSYEEWPKYYNWDTMVDLKPVGARTPTAVADDLDLWLQAQGWERNLEREDPPNAEQFTRYYSREHYTLMVDVYIESPPRAQTISFSITTPSTRPGS